MKITRITTQNFQGIVSADVVVHKPAVLFAGDNHAGKSSLQESIRMALTGEAVRVSLKKEYGALVTDGEKQGYAEVEFDGRRAFITLPSGKATPIAEYVPPPALPYVLNAQRFAKMAANDRRSFLFGLTGLKATPEIVVARLAAKGVDTEKAKLVVPLLRAGFPDACKEAKSKATEAKGAWRATTGEAYGSVKADTWAAAKPDVDAQQATKAAEAVRDIDQQIADANQTLGGLQSDKRRHDEQRTRVQTLTEKADKLDRLQKKLATDEGELKTWQEKVEALEGVHQTDAGLPCPHCRTMLVLSAGALTVAEPASAEPVNTDQLPEYRRARDLLVSAVANSKRDIHEAETSAAELKSIAAAEGKAPTDAQIEVALKTVADLRTKRVASATELDRLKNLTTAAADADTLTKKAKAHHADVAAWDAIGDALAPDGIPGEMLAEALKPINERLQQTAADTEWAEVKVGSDMEILVETSAAANAWRAYGMLSESEQWRVDAMVAEAISFKSGLKLIVLDRFDVLDMKGRADLLAWLDILAENEEIDTALLFGTLKALPSNVPATVQTEWISNGHVGQLKEAA